MFVFIRKNYYGRNNTQFEMKVKGQQYDAAALVAVVAVVVLVAVVDIKKKKKKKKKIMMVMMMMTVYDGDLCGLLLLH